MRTEKWFNRLVTNSVRCIMIELAGGPFTQTVKFEFSGVQIKYEMIIRPALYSYVGMALHGTVPGICQQWFCP